MQTASLEIPTEDHLYVLSESLDTFVENCDPRYWRAVEAAEELISQVKKLRESTKSK